MRDIRKAGPGAVFSKQLAGNDVRRLDPRVGTRPPWVMSEFDSRQARHALPIYGNCTRHVRKKLLCRKALLEGVLPSSARFTFEQLASTEAQSSTLLTHPSNTTDFAYTALKGRIRFWSLLRSSQTMTKGQNFRDWRQCFSALRAQMTSVRKPAIPYHPSTSNGRQTNLDSAGNLGILFARSRPPT